MWVSATRTGFIAVCLTSVRKRCCLCLLGTGRARDKGHSRGSLTSPWLILPFSPLQRIPPTWAHYQYWVWKGFKTQTTKYNIVILGPLVAACIMSQPWGSIKAAENTWSYLTWGPEFKVGFNSLKT